MRLKSLLLIIFSLLSFEVSANIQQRVSIYTQQTELLREICFTPSGVFLEDKILFDVRGSIRETAIDCNAQVLALEEERLAIEAQMQTCDIQNITDQGLIGLLNGNSAVVSELTCPGAGNAQSCTEDLACNLLTSTIPVGAAAAQFAFPNHPKLTSCAKNGNCLTNIGKAIWDHLWDTVKSIYDLGKMGVNWVSSLWKAEDETSNRGIAATEITDSELDKFLADPIDYVYDFGARFMNMIGENISKRYGCGEWSGAPYVSECIQPMSWECANCSERMNMVCGVVAYLGANVVTNFFTGGTVAAAQISAKLAGTVAIRIAEAIPGAARIAETMSVAGRLSKAGSLISGTLKNLWGAVSASRTVKGLSSVASKLKAGAIAGNALARKSIYLYAAGQDGVIAAAKAYNRITMGAFRAGYRATGNAAEATRNHLYAQYPKLSDIMSGKYAHVSNTEDYLREATKGMSAEERARMRITTTTDSTGNARVVVHDTRIGTIDSDISYNFTPEPPPQRIVAAPQPARAPAEVPPPQPSSFIDKPFKERTNGILLEATENDITKGADLTHFSERQIAVRRALEDIGYTSEHAIELAERLFKSGALGRIPPPDDVSRIIRSTSSGRIAAQEAYVEQWASRTATTESQNGLYINLALKPKASGTFFLDTQNTALKRLNDTLRDKQLVDAFGNRYNDLVQTALEQFRKNHPDITIEMYSDYKSMRAAIRGPPGQQNQLMDELAGLIDNADITFRNELRASGLVDEASISERWFRSGLGETADEANLVTRFSRRGADAGTRRFSQNTITNRIRSAWTEVESTRSQLAQKFGNTTLFDDGIPTAEVLEVIRKNSDPQDIARILSGRYNKSITSTDAEKFQQYFDQVDQFSPGLLIKSRVEHRFDQAIHGGFSIDFSGVGSVNAHATARGLREGQNVGDAIARVRLRELDVTRELDALKLRTETAVRDALRSHGVEAQITVSGDDMLVVPNKPLTDEMRRRIAEAQVAAQRGTSTRPSGMRTSFFPSGVQDQAARSIQATIGETVEKKLRKKLEGVLTQDELNNTLFAVNMRGTTPGTGRVDLQVVNPNLSTASKSEIDRVFTRALEDINKELIDNGQAGSLSRN